MNPENVRALLFSLPDVEHRELWGAYASGATTDIAGQILRGGFAVFFQIFIDRVYYLAASSFTWCVASHYQFFKYCSIVAIASSDP